jgi:hypothetical protein
MKLITKIAAKRNFFKKKSVFKTFPDDTNEIMLK